MSIKIMTQVWDHANVKGGSLVVLLALADFADDDGYCWPHVDKIATKARLSERQVYNVLNDLEARGYIEREAQGRESLYRVTPEGSPDNSSGEEDDHLQTTTGSPAIRDSDHLQSATAYKEEPSVEPSKEPSALVVTDAPPRAAPKRRSQATRLPESWQPTTEHARSAERSGVDLEHEAAVFRAHAAANDRRQVNWNAAFAQWLLQAHRYAPRNGNGSRPAAPTLWDAEPGPIWGGPQSEEIAQLPDVWDRGE